MKWKTEFPKNIAPFRDTEATLRAKLLQGIADFTRQGFLPRDAAGRIRWGFVENYGAGYLFLSLESSAS